MNVEKEELRGIKRQIENIESQIVDLKEQLDKLEETGTLSDASLKETLISTRKWLIAERDDLKDFLWFYQDRLSKQ